MKPHKSSSQNANELKRQHPKKPKNNDQRLKKASARYLGTKGNLPEFLRSPSTQRPTPKDQRLTLFPADKRKKVRGFSLKVDERLYGKATTLAWTPLAWTPLASAPLASAPLASAPLSHQSFNYESSITNYGLKPQKQFPKCQRAKTPTPKKPTAYPARYLGSEGNLPAFLRSPSTQRPTPKDQRLTSFPADKRRKVRRFSLKGDERLCRKPVTLASTPLASAPLASAPLASAPLSHQSFNYESSITNYRLKPHKTSSQNANELKRQHPKKPKTKDQRLKTAPARYPGPEGNLPAFLRSPSTQRPTPKDQRLT